MYEIELFKPYDKQLEVIEACENPDIFYVVCIAGRQSGKTTMAENLAIKWCLQEAGVKVIWISPTDNQAAVVYQEILEIIRKSELEAGSKIINGISLPRPVDWAWVKI